MADLTRRTKQSKKVLLTLVILGFFGLSGIAIASNQGNIQLAKGQPYVAPQSNDNC